MKRIAMSLMAVLLFAGCATQTVDWQARIGQYTQNQAITDLGTPDKSTRQSDGTIVDEWLTSRAHVIEAPEPYFLSRGAYVGPDTPNYSEIYAPDYILRLTFAPDGKLKAWKQFPR